MNLNDTEYKELIDKWLEGPALGSPEGVSPDYLDGPSLQKYDVLCQSIGLTLVTTLVLVRVYTRARILKSLGWDDCEYPRVSTHVLSRHSGHLESRLSLTSNALPVHGYFELS